ncbi:HAD-superfamily hydrolase, subfamily IA, variant 3 [Sulfobacillus acidophilus DSM 10332]|uniref:HAD-superfamily hydrolase, subfamily IA, variant 3 n=1 Tax=Sulfobacillus acidophilus (strain ATCC 700253 / DSM 10332 / NAL) TaxID=679936 RepID=G8TWG3_SULAD|nr:HAD-superfamily hydrolase, subfamily IA, variant 3 [Sulfobacillus acidophilus DSM 10332]
MSAKPLLRAVIFDVDGTLADTEAEGHRVAFNEAFKTWGLPVYWDVAEYGRWLGVPGGKERIAAYWRAHPELPPISESEIRALHEFKTRLYHEMVDQGAILLRPGIVPLLHSLSEHGIRVAIATTTARPNVEHLLEATIGPAGTHPFDVIVAGDEVPQKKPAPDVYWEALRQLDLTPAEAVAVEDSEPGYQAAVGATLATVVVTNAYSEGRPFPLACRILDNFMNARVLDQPDHEPISQVTATHLADWAGLRLPSR